MNGFSVGRRAALVAFALLSVTGPVAAADLCAAPAELTADVQALPHVAAVLKEGATLNVLTIGSATVFSPTESLQPGTVTGRALGLEGAVRSNATPNLSDAAFPLQMAQVLRASTPGLKVDLTVKGGRGMTAVEMLDIIRAETASHHYQLVIWQTGTVEAVHNVHASSFFETLSDGATAIAQAGADLVLVDPQFSRFLRANADLDPYAKDMEQIAARPGAMLFHRYELMRHWANEGQIDLERTAKNERLKAVEALHACLGASLARMVLAGARTAS